MRPSPRGSEVEIETVYSYPMRVAEIAPQRRKNGTDHRRGSESREAPEMWFERDTE